MNKVFTMTLRKIFSTKNNQVIIDLPESFRNKKEVLVIVDDNISGSTEKLNLIRNAMTDQLFLDDISEVKKDFSGIDGETL